MSYNNSFRTHLTQDSSKIVGGKTNETATQNIQIGGQSSAPVAPAAAAIEPPAAAAAAAAPVAAVVPAAAAVPVAEAVPVAVAAAVAAPAVASVAVPAALPPAACEIAKLGSSLVSIDDIATLTKSIMADAIANVAKTDSKQATDNSDLLGQKTSKQGESAETQLDIELLAQCLNAPIASVSEMPAITPDGLAALSLLFGGSPHNNNNNNHNTPSMAQDSIGASVDAPDVRGKLVSSQVGKTTNGSSMMDCDLSTQLESSVGASKFNFNHLISTLPSQTVASGTCQIFDSLPPPLVYSSSDLSNDPSIMEPSESYVINSGRSRVHVNVFENRKCGNSDVNINMNVASAFGSEHGGNDSTAHTESIKEGSTSLDEIFRNFSNGDLSEQDVEEMKRTSLLEFAQLVAGQSLNDKNAGQGPSTRKMSGKRQREDRSFSLSSLSSSDNVIKQEMKSKDDDSEELNDCVVNGKENENGSSNGDNDNDNENEVKTRNYRTFAESQDSYDYWFGGATNTPSKPSWVNGMPFLQARIFNQRSTAKTDGFAAYATGDNAVCDVKFSSEHWRQMQFEDYVKPIQSQYSPKQQSNDNNNNNNNNTSDSGLRQHRRFNELKERRRKRKSLVSKNANINNNNNSNSGSNNGSGNGGGNSAGNGNGNSNSNGAANGNMGNDNIFDPPCAKKRRVSANAKVTSSNSNEQ